MEKRFKFVTKKNNPLDIKRKKKLIKGVTLKDSIAKEFSKIFKNKKNCTNK